MWYVYILDCGRTFYVGITSNLERRLSEHLSRQEMNAFTARNSVKKFLYKEEFDSRFSAEKREKQLKGWSRAKKLALIAGDVNLLKSLSVSRE